MTKRQVFSTIIGIIIISIIGGFIWLKKAEKDINQTSKKTFREYNSKNRDLFNDNDFNVTFKDNNFLNFKTKIKSPFNKVIEESKLSLRLILTYEKGTIKYTSVIRNIDPFKYRWKYFDFDGFFNQKDFTKFDLEKVKEFLEYETLIETYKKATKGKNKRYHFNDGSSIDEKGYKDNLSLLKNELNDLSTQYNEQRRGQLEKGLIEFEKYFYNDVYSENHFKLNRNYVFNSNCNIHLEIFDDFTQQKDSLDIKSIPTINLFTVKKATLEVYLEASNTNGFYFNNKVKSINLTDKWNDYFVFKKRQKTKEYDISNAIKITIPNTLEKRSSNSDSEIVMSKVKDIFNEEIGVKSQIVFQPKGTNQLNLTEISDETKILVKYSKNDSTVNFPNWNEQISEDDKKSLFNSVKTSLISFHEKNFPNIDLEWLETESGEANKNKYFKISHLAKQESNITQTSSYIFWNINESVMITYSTKLNDKEKWDKVFLKVLETIDFKNKK